MSTFKKIEELPEPLRRVAQASRNSTKFMVTHGSCSNRLEDLAEAAFKRAEAAGYTEEEVIKALILGDESACPLARPMRKHPSLRRF